ncbi:MAG: hypothetical protein QHH27_08080 [Clostridia bacterium]|nr:general stress protein [Clostridia bacterium]MDH7573487.1 hypothetical protein [Clostridia bacterium]
MDKTVIGAFTSREAAEAAVHDLRGLGFSREISVVAKGDQSDQEGGGSVAEGATTGGVLGGLAGLALGAGALAIPGLGPIIAAGPIAAALSGAATGGLAGSLIDWGIPEAEGRRYEEDVRQGKTLVSVRSDANRADQAATVLRRHGGENVRLH